MTLPIWMLLGFALWTLLLMITTVGGYRWSLILTGRAEIGDFRAGRIEGADWYLRAMRAHANCVENLPVFAVIVFALHVAGVAAAATDAMAATVLVARIPHSIVHVAFRQTNVVTSIRGAFFAVQFACFLGMAAVLIYRVW